MHFWAIFFWYSIEVISMAKTTSTLRNLKLGTKHQYKRLMGSIGKEDTWHQHKSNVIDEQLYIYHELPRE